jgi:hypothetical protein
LIPSPAKTGILIALPMTALILLQPLRQLSGRGRLSRSLQPDDHHRVRPARREEQPARRSAEHLDHLVVHDLDDLLPRRKLLIDLLPDRLRSDPLNEILDDLEVHVGFEQRDSDLAHRQIEMLRRQATFAAQILDYLLELV